MLGCSGARPRSGDFDRVTGEHVFAFQNLFNTNNLAALEAKFAALAKSEAKQVAISAENLCQRREFQIFRRNSVGLRLHRRPLYPTAGRLFWPPHGSNGV